MQFSLEHDLGASIQCYLIPDAAGSTPSLRLFSKGKQLAELQADNIRPDIVAAGRHATGQCGFNITEAALPDLASFDDLELREAESGMLIYRRPQPSFLMDTKVFRLETHLLPLWRFDDAFQDRLQFWYKGVERHGLETSMQLFYLHRCTSLYLSGRMQFQNIEVYLADFKSIVLLRDPYYELAERLLVLKNLPQDKHDLLGPRDILTFRPVVDYLKESETFDAKFCKNFIKWAPDDVLKILSNPVSRQLSSPNADEAPTKNALASALQALSSFDVVGVRDDSDFFSKSVGEILDVGRPLPVLKEYKKVVELGEHLRELGRADMILEHDLEIFHHVKQAFASAEKPKVL